MSSEFGTRDTVTGLGGRLRELKQGSYGSWKPGKFWNFVMEFSRTGKTLKKATRPGKFWKSDKFNQKKMKCMEGSKKH